MDQQGFYHCNRELSSTSSVSFYNLNIFRRHSCRFPLFCRDNHERNAPDAGGRECVIKSAKFLCFSIKIQIFWHWLWKAMKTRGRFIHFWGTPPNSIGFHCKAVFFHCSATPVVGVTLGKLEKLFFLNTIHHFFRPNSIGFHCKVGFSHCSTAPVVGVPFGELNKNHFFNAIWKEINHFGDIRNYIFWHQP